MQCLIHDRMDSELGDVRCSVQVHCGGLIEVTLDVVD